MLRRLCPLVLLLAVSAAMANAHALYATPLSLFQGHLRSPHAFAPSSLTFLPVPDTRAGDLRRSSSEADNAFFRTRGAVQDLSTPSARQDTATFRGRVTNAAGDAIAGAQLLLLGTRVQLITGQNGWFHQAGLPAGVCEVEVRHLGYESQRLKVELRPGEAAPLTISLLSKPVELAEVRVAATRSPQAFGGFYDRRARGPGYFITREDIDQRRPRQLSDMLRLVPGLWLNPGPYGTFDVVVGRARTVVSPCRVQLYLNGMPHDLAGFINLDGIRVTEIEGVEVYRNPGEVPARFRGMNASCGVIAIWIRDGAPRRQVGS